MNGGRSGSNDLAARLSFAWRNTSIPASFQRRLHSRWARNYDLSLFKNFKPLEKLTVQLRAESFNAFNHPQLGAPDSNVSSVTFGKISGTANGPRNTQVALKLLF